MFIADAQVHIWAAHTPERPWPEHGFARTHRAAPLGADELLIEMNAAGVDRAMLVPPSFEGDYNVLSLAAAAAHPGRFAVMERIALTDPASADRLPRSYRQCITHFTEELPFPRGGDLEVVTAHALCDWIGWTMAR